MSKRGSPYLRHALWQAASMAVLHDPQLKNYYQRNKAEGKHHGTAIGAVSRKLVARIYIILKENRPYEIRYWFINVQPWLLIAGLYYASNDNRPSI